MIHSFVEDYMKTTENTKPVKEYHIWSMLGTLSAFAGRRFWFPFGPYAYYPNLYVVLVGDPGTGKSSAMNRAKNIVRASGICPVAATKITKEALTQTMSSTVEGKPKKIAFAGQKFFEAEGRKWEYNQYAIFSTELVDFIAVDPQGFLDFMTTIWDEPVYEVETKNKGNDLIVGPYISMLACMTPEKLKGYMKMSILTGGFARRTAFMFASTKNIVPWPTYTQEQREAEERCIQFGKDLQGKAGVFGITEETKKFYEDWNEENERTMTDRPPTTRGWYESKGEMLFKLSMLIALAEEKGERLMIELPYYKLALHYCRILEATLERVFEGAGINPAAAVSAQICRMLEAMNVPMNKKHLLAMFFDQAPNLNELNDTLTHLCNVGRLAEFVVKDAANNELGRVIGHPSCLTNYTASQMAAFLKRRVVRPDETEAGPSLEGGPARPPDSLPQD